jgi:hypothetical protein
MTNRFEKCEILDDDEIHQQEENRSIFNFRRFDASELERRSSPFDKSQKKEFPFLFQKKSKRFTEEKKISLDELTSKLESISFDIRSIDEEEYKSLTPPYPPNMNDGDDGLKPNDKMEEETDGKK